MSQIDFQGLFGPSGKPCSHVTRKIWRHPLTSGHIVEAADIDSMVLDAGGSSQSDTVHNGVQTICGCIVSQLEKLAQCQFCLGLACRELHISPCAICSAWACFRHRQVISRPDGKPVVLCAACAKEASRSRLGRLIRQFIYGGY